MYVRRRKGAASFKMNRRIETEPEVNCNDSMQKELLYI